MKSLKQIWNEHAENKKEIMFYHRVEHCVREWLKQISDNEGAPCYEPHLHGRYEMLTDLLEVLESEAD